MAVARARVVRLLNESEYQLYEATRRGRVGDHTPAQLTRMIDRTRKHQSKFRALAEQQKGVARGKRPVGKGGRKPEGNDNTQAKADVFTEILERLVAAQAKAEKAAANPKPTPPTKKQAKSARRTARKTASTTSRHVPRKPAAKTGRASSKAKAKRTTTPAARRAAAAAAIGTDLKAKAKTVDAKAKGPTQSKGQQKSRLAMQKSRLGHIGATTRRNQAKRDKRND